MLAVAAACLALAKGLRGYGGTQPWIPVACGIASLAIGIALGSESARLVRSACPTTLSTGDVVEAVGILREETDPGPGPDRVRLTLLGVELDANGRRCLLPAVTVYARMQEHLEAGLQVAVRGEWIRSRGVSLRWPTAPRRQGYISGRLIADAPQQGQAGGKVRSRSGRGPGILFRLRSTASGRLRERLPPDVLPLGLALTLAERDGLSPALRRRFAEAGLAHLLAISGLHVGLIAAAMAWFAALLLPARRAYPAAAVLVVLYVAAIGAPASAVRAALVFAGYAWARTRGRPLRIADLLGVAAAAALIADPLTLLDPGFQLSFAGFAGLLAGAAVARKALRSRGGKSVSGPSGRRRAVRLGIGLAVGLAAGSGAFAATAPIVAAHFQQTAPVAVVSHVVGTPLVALALASLGGTMLLPAGPGALAAAAATVLLRLLYATVTVFARLPFGHGQVTPPGPVGWMAALLLAVAAWRYLGVSGRRGALVPLGAAAALLLAGPALSAHAGRGDTLLCTLDVGQGDAAVLRTTGGRWLVFDGGPRFGRRDAGRDVIVPRLLRGGAREVELFVLSHPDLDHIGGSEALFSRYRVRRVLDSGDPIPRPVYQRFLATVEEEGTEWLRGRAGDRLRVDNVELTVLGPPRANARPPPGSEGTIRANETSLSFRVTVSGGFRYINTGDATEREERGLLAAWPRDSLVADLLKVGHHGSRTSSHLAWLRTVRPALAVISAGAGNAYGHPHPSILARLDSAAAGRVWRTDRRGTLCVEVDGVGRWRVAGDPEWRLPRVPATRDLTAKMTGE